MGWTSIRRNGSLILACLILWLAPVDALAAQVGWHAGNARTSAVRLRPQGTAVRGQWVVFQPVAGGAATAAPGALALAKPAASVPASPQTVAPASYPSAAGAGPAIVGSEAFQRKVQQALDLLKTRAPASWEIVRANLLVIREAAASGAYVTERRYDIGPVTAASDPIWLASTIVHDAYHVQLYREGKPYMGAEGEAAALAKQREALVALGAPAYMIAHLDNVMATRYWEVPYTQRNW